MKPKRHVQDFIGSDNTLIKKYLREHSFKDMCLDLGFVRELPSIFYRFETCPFCNSHHVETKGMSISDSEVHTRLIEYNALIDDDVHLYSQYSFCWKCNVLLNIEHQFLDNIFTDPFVDFMNLRYMLNLIESLERPYPREVFANRIRGASQDVFFDFNPGNPQKTISANIIYRAIYRKYAHEPPTLSLIPKNAL